MKASERKDGLVSRPELEVFGLAMLGGGMVFGAAHPYGELVLKWDQGKRGVLTVIDYPWGELGEATVVDVGGGVGKFRPCSFLAPGDSCLVLISFKCDCWLT